MYSPVSSEHVEHVVPEVLAGNTAEAVEAGTAGCVVDTSFAGQLSEPRVRA